MGWEGLQIGMDRESFNHTSEGQRFFAADSVVKPDLNWYEAIHSFYLFYLQY